MPVISLTSKEVAFLSERDYRLRHLMQQIGDLEYSRPESAFHSLAHSIIEQMLSMKAGRAIESRLRELCEGDYMPECIVDIPAENIESCGMSFRKAQSLKMLAEYALENDLEALADLPDEEVYKNASAASWHREMDLRHVPAVLPRSSRHITRRGRRAPPGVRMALWVIYSQQGSSGGCVFTLAR